MRYPKQTYGHRFYTLEKCIKESPWGDTWKIRIWRQEETLEAGEDILTPTNIPSQLPKNLEVLDKYVLVANIMRDYMAKLWFTNDILGQDER